MGDIDDPIDVVRTTRPRDGMVWKDRRELPGLILLVVAALGLVGLLTAAAMHDPDWALRWGVLVAVTAVGGVSWILLGRRRTARVSQLRHQR